MYPVFLVSQPAHLTIPAWSHQSLLAALNPSPLLTEGCGNTHQHPLIHICHTFSYSNSQIVHAKKKLHGGFKIPIQRPSFVIVDDVAWQHKRANKDPFRSDMGRDYWCSWQQYRLKASQQTCVTKDPHITHNLKWVQWFAIELEGSSDNLPWCVVIDGLQYVSKVLCPPIKKA